jgi:RecB family exonuclease
MRASYSSLETYKTCPLKYKFQEIDKIKTPKSKEAVFGTVVHATLKFIHNPGILSPTLEQALDYFAKSWNSEVFESELEERSAFSQGIQMIQDYYSKNEIATAKIVDLESRFQIELGDHIIAGIIDRIDKTDDGYEIIDYKTTRKMPTQDKVDNDLQLSIYLKAFLARYPKEIERLDKIKVSLYFLKHGVKLSSTRTLEQLQKSEQLFLETIKAIESGTFEPTISPLCDWCGYQKMCPMWKHKFKDERKIDTEEVNAAIAKYIELKAESSKQKVQLAKIQEAILSYMNQEGVDRVFGPRGIVARTLRKTYKYDAEKLREILQPLDKWESVLKVDGIALNKILATLPFAVKTEAEKTKIPDKETTSLSIKKTALEDEE